MADEKKPSISKAPPPITPIRGGRNMPEVKVRRQPAIALDWSYWPASCSVSSFQAAALSLGINPESVKSSDSYDAVVGRFERACFPDDATEAEFIERYRLLERIGMSGPEPLRNFAEKLSTLPLPLEFSNMQATPKKWNIAMLSSVSALEWARKPCWSLSEALLLSRGYLAEGENTSDVLPSMGNVVGKEPDLLNRAILAGQLKPIGKDDNGEDVFAPCDIIAFIERHKFDAAHLWRGALDHANELNREQAASADAATPPVGDDATETPKARRQRLRARCNELKSSGVRAWQKQVAREEKISPARIRAIVADDDETPSKPEVKPFALLAAYGRKGK